jgi:hypothetical protein
VLGKFALALGILAVLVGALWLSGAVLSRGDEETARADSADSINPEANRLEWIDHVSAICDWERKRFKTLKRVYREGSSGVPKDLELLLLAVIRMGDESKAIFNRLTPPFEYRREVQELRSRFRDERRALDGLVDAVRNGDRRAFLRHWRDLAKAGARKVDMLRNLGLTKCVPRLLPPEPEERKTTIV